MLTWKKVSKGLPPYFLKSIYLTSILMLINIYFFVFLFSSSFSHVGMFYFIIISVKSLISSSIWVFPITCL